MNAATRNCRICLVGSMADLAAASLRLDRPFANGLVAAVVAVPPAAKPIHPRQIRAASDEHDVAFLVAEDVALARELTADGIEIEWSPEGYASARAALGTDLYIGCRAGLSRHRAMEAAEAGADYVRLRGVGEEETGALIEMVEWWSELIEIPCMADGAASPDVAARLAAAGADFVAVGAAFDHGLTPADWFAAIGGGHLA